MAKTFFYIVDSLDSQNAVALKQALGAVPEIRDITIWVAKGVVEVQATRDIEDSLKLACGVAGIGYRAKTDRRKTWSL